MARRHLLAWSALIALTASPASAQIFGERAPARTILLSPGWHLDGKPSRSAEGLHMAVRNDAGATQEVTVSPSGAISFAPRTSVAKPKPRKQKVTRTSLRTTPVIRSQKLEDAPRPRATEAAVTPASTLRSVDVPAVPAAAVAAPPIARPQPARTGPGFAHGVPINPLD